MRQQGWDGDLPMDIQEFWSPFVVRGANKVLPVLSLPGVKEPSSVNALAKRLRVAVYADYVVGMRYCLVNYESVPVDNAAGFDLRYIALIVGFPVVLIVVVFIILYRNRGGTCRLGKKERKAGNNPEQELQENNFQDAGRVDDFNDDSGEMETGMSAEALPLSDGNENAEIGKGSDDVLEDGSDDTCPRKSCRIL
ncbi:hypothetical protein DPMN_194244 [Dreissena polymorpha]|uniref:Uncharacterized protein n=1 Tax=Dreissena polymorpha TaxID=45954 RepID=A0A9D3Y1E3_DREPO|nr:hypothetical protein DPMN_194244 [Dreissena polymorpha]